MHNKNLWVLVFIAVVISIMFWSAASTSIQEEMPYYLKKVINETGTVTIRGKTVEVEVARTASARAKGLSGRASMPYERGMIFVFDEPSVHSFTMRNTKISLDIIWISNDTIAHIVHEAQPEEEHINPDVAANYVLEVNGGFARRAGWEDGDAVSLTFDKE